MHQQLPHFDVNNDGFLDFNEYNDRMMEIINNPETLKQLSEEEQESLRADNQRNTRRFLEADKNQVRLSGLKILIKKVGWSTGSRRVWRISPSSHCRVDATMPRHRSAWSHGHKWWQLRRRRWVSEGKNCSFFCSHMNSWFSTWSEMPKPSMNNGLIMNGVNSRRTSTLVIY